MIRGVIILAALVLMGCDDSSIPKRWTHDEIEDIANDVASDMYTVGNGENSAAASKIETLESDISDLASKVRRQELEISSLRSQIDNLETQQLLAQ